MSAPTAEQLLEMRYQLTQFFADPKLIEAYAAVEASTRALTNGERLFVLAFATCLQTMAVRSPVAQGVVTAYLRSAHDPAMNGIILEHLSALLGVALVPPPPRHPIDDEGRS